MCKSYDVEPLLLRPAEPVLRVLVEELFLAGPYLLSLQVGAGIAIESRELARAAMAPHFEIFQKIDTMRMVSFFQVGLRLSAH